MLTKRGHLTLVHSTTCPAHPCVKARPKLVLYQGGKNLAGSFNAAKSNDNVCRTHEKGPRPYHQATPGRKAPLFDDDGGHQL